MSEKLQTDCDNWDEMTPEQKRIAVAGDVISLINTGRIIVRSGTYLEIPKSYKPQDDAKTVFLEEPCTVCAKGAIVVAKVCGRNNVTLEGLGINIGWGYCSSNGDPSKHARDVFTPEQLDHMENAFEGGWKNEYYDDKDRLVAIMERVINNKGEFTGEDALCFGEADWNDDDFDDFDDFDDDDDWDDDDEDDLE